jgi:Type I phosphodiesterase / nucleotide pyrophosphatase
MQAHVLAYFGPHREQHALTLVVAGTVLVRLAEIPGDDGAFNGTDDLAERDVLRGPSQDVTAPDPPLGSHQAGALQRQQDLLQVGLRQSGPFGDIPDRGGLSLAGVQGQREERPTGVITPGGHLHVVIVPLGWSGMTVPMPVLPSYGGANLASLVPGLLEPPGRRPVWLPEVVQEARQVILLVADGLGWVQLGERADLAPNLVKLTGGPITSVVPSTTATALTSLIVGAPPAAHGIVGYRVVVPGPTGPEVMNVLRWRTVSGDARPFVDPRAFQPLEPFLGHAVPVVSKSEFAGTAFTEAHQRGVPVAGWAQASSLAVEARKLLRAGEPLVYAYYEGVDKIAHIYGFGEYYDAELVALDRVVGDLLDVLPTGAVLAVTADHGQVQVGSRAEAIDSRVIAETAMLSGEGRFRWLHAQPGGGAVDRLEAKARERYEADAWVVTLDEMESEGWFGGPLKPEFRARLGDVALIPFVPVAYLDPADSGDARLVCRHGSLTPEEMLVPLVAGDGRLGA